MIPKFKIILAGPADVGKTSLINRYCEGFFREDHQETIGVSFKVKHIILEDKFEIYLHIWDIIKDGIFKKLAQIYIKGAQGALVLYDITNKNALMELKDWVSIIKENSKNDLTIVLIGTKLDLEEKRAILKLDAIKLSKELGCQIQPFETSAKTGENVNKTFSYIANELADKYEVRTSYKKKQTT